MKRILGYLCKGCLFFLKQLIQGVIIVGIMLIVLIAGITYTMNGYGEETKEIKGNSFLELDFSKEVREKEINDIFEIEKNPRFYQILEGIKNATSDNKIEGIVLNIDNIKLSTNHIEEIGEALDKFKKSGKKVYAFTRNMNNQNYKLGIYADKIVMPPIKSANIDISGYYREFNYFKGLADYVGVKFNVVHIGDYKAYGEQYSKEHMSEEFKGDIKRVYDRIFLQRIEEISKRRKLESFTVERSIENGELVMIDPMEGEKLGLIDELDYETQFETKYKIKNKVSLTEYLASVEKKEAKDKIAIIYASGNIVYNGSMDTKNTIDIKSIEKELKRASEDEDIKGIVLRVNSPGGSALASEVIHHELSKIKKPIYVSMGSVAASGGYYISSGADKIFATKSTITGSIGVVSIIPDITELVSKTKINVEKIEKGKYSGIYSVNSKMTEDEYEKIKKSSLGVYDDFKDRVSNGRKIPLNELEEISGGRIWLGEEAVKNRLVDEIGGLEDTIKAMGEKLKLTDYQVVEIVEKKSVYEEILGYKNVYSRIESFIKSPTEEITEFKVKTPLLLLPYDFN
jgi:protease-4